jgi:hypothetical protein
VGQIIARSIYCRVDLLRVDSSQGRFCCKNFFVATRRYWKASFIEIYLIEMYNFWSEHENWVHLVVKSFLSPPRATEKLVLEISF